MPSSPPEPSVSASYEAPHDAAPASMPDVPREAAPERDFSPPARSEPVETDFARSAPDEGMDARGRATQEVEQRREPLPGAVAESEAWSPPERSFEEAPPAADREDRGNAPQAEPAAAESSGESVSVPTDERQAG